MTEQSAETAHKRGTLRCWLLGHKDRVHRRRIDLPVDGPDMCSLRAVAAVVTCSNPPASTEGGDR